MRSVARAAVGGWLALLVAGGCANVLGLDEYGPEPAAAGGQDPGGEPLGAPCDDDAICESGICSSGLCCDAACDEACLGCDLDGLEGSCRPRPAGATNIACVGICDGDGGCLRTSGEAEAVGGAGNQRGHSLDVNEQGRLAIAGMFDGELTFEGGLLPFAGAFDGFVAVFEAAGGLAFQRAVGGAGDERLYAVALGPQGQVAATGYATAGFTFAGMPRTYNPAGDPIVIAYNPTGMELWAASPQQNPGLYESGYAVVIDDAGRTWAAGDIADADGLGLRDGFLNVYDTSGNEAFPAIRLGADGFTSGVRGMAIDRERGQIVVAGFTDGPLSLPMVQGEGIGDSDPFVIAFDSSGALLWGEVFPSATGSSIPIDVAFDEDGGFAVTGLARGEVSFGGPTLMARADVDNEANALWDIFVASFDSSGAHRFSQVFPAPGDQIARTVLYDGGGRLLVAGAIAGAVELGPSAPFLPVSGATDAFLGRFTSSGQHLFSTSFGDAGNQQIWDAVAAPDGRVHMVGWGGGAFTAFGDDLTTDGQDVLRITLPP